MTTRGGYNLMADRLCGGVDYHGPKRPPPFSNTTCYRIYHLRSSNLLSHTESTTCEAAISYLTQNLLPCNMQCCRRHKIYHLQYNDLLSHTGFVSSYGNTL